MFTLQRHIHIARRRKFDHDFHHFVDSCEKDQRVIHAISLPLKGSDRPFIITSGTGIGDDGDTALAREDQFKPDNMNPLIASITPSRLRMAGAG